MGVTVGVQVFVGVGVWVNAPAGGVAVNVGVGERVGVGKGGRAVTVYLVLQLTERKTTDSKRVTIKTHRINPSLDNRTISIGRENSTT